MSTRVACVLAVVAIGCGSTRATEPEPANRVEPPKPVAPAPADAGVPTLAHVEAFDDTPFVDVEGRCTAGDSAACTQLGTRLRTGSRGAPHDLPRAFAVLDAACTAQHRIGPACSHLAELHLGGHGTTRDNPRGMEILVRACDGGELEACRFLGVVLYEGLASPDVRYSADNQRLGVEVLERACKAGYAPACASADSRRGPPSAPP